MMMIQKSRSEKAQQPLYPHISPIPNMTLMDMLERTLDIQDAEVAVE